MSVHVKPTTDPVTDDDSKPTPSVVVPDDKPKVEQVSSRGGKELDFQRVEEAKLLKEVVKESDSADDEAESIVKEQIDEAKLSKPKIKVPQDILDSGVKSPEKDARDVIVNGSTITLPVSEDEYKKGESIKIDGKKEKKDIIGVSSLAALSMFVTRIIKAAHKHAKNVIFKNSSALTEDKKEEK